MDRSLPTTCNQHMTKDDAIRAINLGKVYQIYSHRQLLAAQPIQMLMGNRHGQKLHALQDVTFSVQKGEIFGIIGHNGSGKSTLLKLLSGVTRPDSGTFELNGRLTSLLELGAGFQPELTGRENLYLYGSLVGLPRDHIAAHEQGIIDFSGIEAFIDLPVKTYSSGMMIRLAFATAIHTDPEILLLDEVLGVGDVEFIHRSFQAIQKAVDRGVTVVIVSHGLSFIGSFCSRVMCLHQGRIAAIGAPETVINTYMELISDREMVCELTRGDTRLRFLPSGFHIEHQEKMYTVVRGVSVILRKWDAEFYSSEAAFTVLESNDHEVVLQLRWGHWNLEQIWRVHLLPDGTIEWTIENGDNLHVAVDTVEVELMVSSGFNRYVLPEEIRVFPKTITRGFNQEFLLADQHSRQYFGVTDGTDGRLSVIVDFSRNPNIGSTAVISGGSLLPAQTLQRAFPARMESRKIHATIQLMTSTELERFLSEQHNIPSLKTGLWTISFHDNGIHIHWNGQSVTTAPGMHLKWSEEQFRDKEIELVFSEKMMTVRETYSNVPIVCVWQFQGKSRQIIWEVHLEQLERHSISSPEICFPCVPGIRESVEFTPDTTVWIDSETAVLPADFLNYDPLKVSKTRVAGGRIKMRTGGSSND